MEQEERDMLMAKKRCVLYVGWERCLIINILLSRSVEGSDFVTYILFLGAVFVLVRFGDSFFCYFFNALLSFSFEQISGYQYQYVIRSIHTTHDRSLQFP
jgi:hypothetical protein